MPSPLRPSALRRQGRPPAHPSASAKRSRQAIDKYDAYKIWKGSLNPLRKPRDQSQGARIRRRAATSAASAIVPSDSGSGVGVGAGAKAALHASPIRRHMRVRAGPQDVRSPAEANRPSAGATPASANAFVSPLSCCPGLSWGGHAPGLRPCDKYH